MTIKEAAFYGAGNVRFRNAEPTIIEPTAAIIRFAAACVCGSDLWPYRGIGLGNAHTATDAPLGRISSPRSKHTPGPISIATGTRSRTAMK
jgi:hypothetical protein